MKGRRDGCNESKEGKEARKDESRWEGKEGNNKLREKEREGDKEEGEVNSIWVERI